MALPQERMSIGLVPYTARFIISCNLSMIDCLPCKCDASSMFRRQFDLNTPVAAYDNPFVEAMLKDLYPSISLAKDANVHFSNIRGDSVIEEMEE